MMLPGHSTISPQSLFELKVKQMIETSLECQVNIIRSAIFLSHMNHVSVSPTDGNGPTQG